MMTKLAPAAMAALGALAFAPPTAAQTQVATSALPTGFGLGMGDIALGFSALHGPWRGTGPDRTRYDASTSLAYGFGDPNALVGIDFAANITSFRDFGASGYLSVSLHRRMQFAGGAIGSVNLTATHLAGWGDSSVLDPAYTLVGSYAGVFGGRRVMVSAGVGDGFHRARGTEGLLAVGVAVAPGVAVSGGFIGSSPVIGASWFPGFLPNSVVNLSVRDIDDSARRTVGIDIGYSFNLLEVLR